MAAHEYAFSDKRSCPINLTGTHLCIILNNETDRQFSLHQKSSHHKTFLEGR